MSEFMQFSIYIWAVIIALLILGWAIVFNQIRIQHKKNKLYELRGRLISVLETDIVLYLENEITVPEIIDDLLDEVV